MAAYRGRSTWSLGAMELLLALGCGVIGVGLLSACILLPLRHRQTRILRALSDEDLRLRVFRFEPNYFDYIGLDHPDVVEFRDLVSTRNLSRLRKRWGSLQRSFQRLERRAGRTGRPFILEHYCWYELDLKELARRT
jgi:hypothetical protein